MFQGNYGKDSLPVMVWIHGGGWLLGSGNGETDMYGPSYLLDRDIVLVTINYRVGPMGKNYFLLFIHHSFCYCEIAHSGLILLFHYIFDEFR